MTLQITGFRKLTIEVTTLCNLKCAGCPRTVAVNEGAWVNKSMRLDDFKAILNHLPFVNMVTLHGIGEPTLHKNFIDIVEAAKQSSKFGMIKITTNALAKPAEFYLEAQKKGLDEIWISVDSINQSLSTKLRENTDIVKIQETIKLLAQKNFAPSISMTVSALNFRECLFSAHTLLELGAKTIHMQEYQDFGETEGVMTIQERLEFVERCIEYSRLYPDRSIKFPPFVYRTANKKPVDPSEMCTAPWERPAITVDGYLTPCCTTFDPNLWNKTSLVSQTWVEAYSSSSIKKWIQAYRREKGNLICQGCAIHPQNQDSVQNLGSRPHQAPARAI